MTSYRVPIVRMVTLSRALAALGALAGCAENERHDGLQGWMQQERSQHELRATTPQKFPEFISAAVPTQTFQKRQGIDPFSRLRLLRVAPVDNNPVVQITVSAVKSSQPTLSLETTPLAGIRLVGSMQRDGQPLALLRVNDMIYSARVGDRIGLDQGRITAITLSGLMLRETLLDPAGQLIERIVSLALVSEP